MRDRMRTNTKTPHPFIRTTAQVIALAGLISCRAPMTEPAFATPVGSAGVRQPIPRDDVVSGRTQAVSAISRDKHRSVERFGHGRR